MLKIFNVKSFSFWKRAILVKNDISKKNTVLSLQKLLEKNYSLLLKSYEYIIILNCPYYEFRITELSKTK